MEVLKVIGHFFASIPPAFYGSLIGAFISGSVAVGILAYNTYQKNKEYNFKCYGTMKVIYLHMLSFEEAEDIFLDVIENILKFPPVEEWIEILEVLKIKYFLDVLELLEKERSNIPYNFTSRYYIIIYKLNSIIREFEIFEKTHSLDDLKRFAEKMKHFIEISEEFSNNLAKYANEVERKYKIKDYY